MSSKKRFHIITMGCQMNVYDSEQMERLLATENFVPTRNPSRADVILLNTCAIREKPVHKVHSHLGRLAGLKKKRPDLIIAVGGCVAQQEGRRLLKKAPCVDIVFGTSAVSRLPALVRQVLEEKRRLVDVDENGPADPPEIRPAAFQRGRASAFVTIMTGCDNFCAYCVVPYVRGREVSRSPGGIVREIEHLVEAGVKEVTLLGQNVNSYGAKNGHAMDFPSLLEAVDRIEGLKRIRFTTSHPKDLSERLIAAFGQLEKLAPHIHLPVQSGSDRILKRMHRGYSADAYLEKIAALRGVRPRMGITSDIIVGFPGEKEGDYEETLNLIRTAGFDNVYAFKYSDRPNVPSNRFPGKVPEAAKQERLAGVLAIQAEITLTKNKALEGTVQEVLVEGRSRRDATQATGHTPCNKVVNFPCASAQVGQIVQVEIIEGLFHSLLGAPEGSWEKRDSRWTNGPFRGEGGIPYVA